MEDAQRVTGLLELARQQMQRYHELEELEWKINFSVWTLLGGVAYLWVVNVKLPLPAVLMSKPGAYLLLPIPAMAIHGLALSMLHQQQAERARARDDYRRLAGEILGAPVPDKAKPSKHYRWRYFRWLGWDLIVTFVIGAAVVFLVQHSSPLHGANP
jgi:hypothetical protein